MDVIPGHHIIQSCILLCYVTHQKSHYHDILFHIFLNVVFKAMLKLANTIKVHTTSAHFFNPHVWIGWSNWIFNNTQLVLPTYCCPRKLWQFGIRIEWSPRLTDNGYSVAVFTFVLYQNEILPTSAAAWLFVSLGRLI